MATEGYNRNILITGGAGFIGSHVVRRFVSRYPQYRIVCYDILTYAGNLENLRDIEKAKNFNFVKGDILDSRKVDDTLAYYKIDGIIHLAAESHVDRSIKDPLAFARTNVMGTLTLLEGARRYWGRTPGGFERKMFYHISTDEVYGALMMDAERNRAPYGERLFIETTPYAPHSPYSASKAASDHFVRSYHDTYGMPVVITNCSNNYGPFQFPEKLIPLILNNIIKKKPLPVYGKGENVRDWLYVEDHAEAIDVVFHNGIPGETYNIGGNNEWKNIDIVKEIVRITDSLQGRREGESLQLIKFVEDRKGHDLRYAIDASKIKRTMGWTPRVAMHEGLEKTIRWYLDNKEWLRNVTSGDYMSYYEENYGKRKCLAKE